MADTSVRQDPNRGAAVSFITRLVATGFYSGYSPFAPGTAGSLVGFALYFIPGVANPFVLCTISVGVFALGVITSARMEQRLGEDPPIVVIDEIVGMWISLLFLQQSLLVALLSFVFFRAFDIVKPPPARTVEAYRNGWGIMLDDVVAGVYANAAVRLTLLLLPHGIQ
jgi:phosphatidylglycerophosphatase A